MMIDDVATLVWIAAGLLAFWVVLRILKKILVAVLIGLAIIIAGVLLRGVLW